MILTANKILEAMDSGKIIINPFYERQLNPNSYNLTLADELLIYDNKTIDMAKNNPYSIIKIPREGLLLEPGVLYLGRTNEYTETYGFVPMLEGRSSVGRLGISIHATAGFGDIGFKGFWTLEISCILPVMIYSNVDICQIYYHTIDEDNPSFLYTNGKYQNNKGIQPSMMYKEFERYGY